MRPPFITAIESAIVIASSWSCVTWMKVMPTSCWIVFSSSCICLRSLRSSAPSGSSSSSTRGLFTSARASATRCCWPPESWRGFRALEPGEVDELEDLPHAAAQLLALHALAAHAEGDVLEDRQVREERVALEDGVDVALVRRQARRHRDRRGRSTRRSAPRSRRSSAASSSCRSPTGRGARRSCPGSIEIEMSSTATTSSKRFVTPSRRTSGGAAGAAAGLGASRLAAPPPP